MLFNRKKNYQIDPRFNAKYLIQSLTVQSKYICMRNCDITQDCFLVSYCVSKCNLYKELAFQYLIPEENSIVYGKLFENR